MVRRGGLVYRGDGFWGQEWGTGVVRVECYLINMKKLLQRYKSYVIRESCHVHKEDENGSKKSEGRSK